MNLLEITSVAPTYVMSVFESNRAGAWNGGWFWLWRTLILFVQVGIVALVVWWVLRATRGAEPSGIERARTILAERYARGELSTEEYHDRLERLR